MSTGIANTALPLPTKEYNVEYMSRLIRQLNIAISKLGSVGPFTCGSDLSSSVVPHPVSGLSIINVPTSPTNLPIGSVWCDTSANNVLKIVTG